MIVACPKCGGDRVVQVSVATEWKMINGPDKMGICGGKLEKRETIKLHYWCWLCGIAWYAKPLARARATNNIGALVNKVRNTKLFEEINDANEKG